MTHGLKRIFRARIRTSVICVPLIPTSISGAADREGEGQYVEFKAQLPTSTVEARRTALKTIVVFANGEGGTVLYGVGDDGAVIGLFGVDVRTLDKFNDILRKWTNPMPACECRVESLDGKVGAAGRGLSKQRDDPRPDRRVRQAGVLRPARCHDVPCAPGRTPADYDRNSDPREPWQLAPRHLVSKLTGSPRPGPNGAE